MSDHEVYLLGDLVRDFIRENLMKACDHAIETRGFIAGTKEAVRFTYRYGRIFTESFKEDLISYFKEERAVYLAMNKDRKKKTAYILTEKLNIEVSEEDTVTW